jgi:hypothetical protein
MKKPHKILVSVMVVLSPLGISTGTASASTLATIPQEQVTQIQNDFVAGFNAFLEDQGVDDVLALPMNEREALLNQYIDDPDTFAQTPQPRSVTLTAIAAVVGIIAGSIAIGKGAYQAGQYAAQQANDRGIITKRQWRQNSNRNYSLLLGSCLGMSTVFGAFAANGFNDWMWH